MNKTPVSVMVLSIVGIVLGVLGILGTIWAIVVLVVPIGGPNPVLDNIRHDGIYIGVTAVISAVGLVAACFCIAACIGCLRLKRWARKGLLIYAWYSLAQLVVGLIFNITYVFPKMFSGMSASGAPEARAGLIGGIVGGVCGAIIGLVYPVCVLIFFTRPRVIEAFEKGPPSFPVESAEMPPHVAP